MNGKMYIGADKLTYNIILVPVTITFTNSYFIV